MENSQTQNFLYNTAFFLLHKLKKKGKPQQIF